jgi:purine-nucleoside/S-methyl-5'-thioadenosine phosphorylase / adenosine deaminase
MLTASNLDLLGQVRHGFFTREGGVSEGEFASLNCGYSSGDETARVEANRARALQRLRMAPASLCTVRQVHGAAVVHTRAPQPNRPSVEADGLVTDRSYITLGVLSADCAPVLLADAEAGVIGAAHAGWRGALAGVIEATVEAMIRLGAARDRVIAAVGPCIAQPSYEVGPELLARFTAEDPTCADLFAQSAGSDRLLFDLNGYVLRRLARAGVEQRTALPDDTHADAARFFSARRTRQAGGERFGLMLSAIALVD